jgi:hypothetical protein
MLRLLGIRLDPALIALVGVVALAVGIARHGAALMAAGAVLTGWGAVSAFAAWRRTRAGHCPDTTGVRR